MLATLAGSAGTPTASNAGYETSEVMPPAVPTIPASTPAPTSNRASAFDSISSQTVRHRSPK